ncbi:AAA family ATPase [Halomonas sp. SpR1]|uniref:AAA family ATPase n=1 Tax=Halomonas sp. SpR1 TaxID=3050462 RepID=UPI0027E4D0CC|nr:AAA family ATPase [Halomonas sp. SpR1]MDQ7732005.1 AAA family ATPase [Halomonas sp. SpR1]
MKKLHVEKIAQIKTADVQFGDLTLLVGPQASGKSIFLQLFKLVEDHGPITTALKRYGYSYEPSELEGAGDPLLTLMFGEGMGAIWEEQSRVRNDEQSVSLSSLRKGNSKDVESVFFVPAQRVLTLDQGRPRSYESFAALDPFVVKSFSEKLRRLMEQGLGGQGNQLFPIKSRLKEVLRERIDNSIFHGATVTQQVHDLKKRIVINAGGATLPYMAWSAGQREFMPLLFSLYWLMPSAGSARRKGVDWVVIEEPEMGLHPQAIQSVLLICLELIYRGYKVIISTHSPLLLEAAWAIRTLQEFKGAPEALLELFDLPNSPGMRDVFSSVLSEKVLKSYYFQPSVDGVTTRDISSLDPFSEDDSIADWGGITEFSSRASEVISRLMQGAGE